MDFIKLIGMCILAAMIGMFLKNNSPSMGVLLGAFVSVSVISVCVVYFIPYASFFYELSEGTGFSSYAAVLVKVCGIGILTTTAAEICTDFGENVYASKAKLIGKTAILLCALPILKNIFLQINVLINT